MGIGSERLYQTIVAGGMALASAAAATEVVGCQERTTLREEFAGEGPDARVFDVGPMDAPREEFPGEGPDARVFDVGVSDASEDGGVFDASTPDADAGARVPMDALALDGGPDAP